MALGQNILELRKQKGVSQEQLGLEIGVTRQTVSNWELDETAPNPEQLKALSKFFGVSIDNLLDNDAVDFNNVNKKRLDTNKKLISKIIKYVLIVFAVFLVIDAITFAYIYFNKKGPFKDKKQNTCITTEYQQNQDEFEYDVYIK